MTATDQCYHAMTPITIKSAIVYYFSIKFQWSCTALYCSLKSFMPQYCVKPLTSLHSTRLSTWASRI